MIKIRISKDAAIYLRKETEYLRRRNPTAASNFASSISNARRVLQSFPEAGNTTHGLTLAGHRTLVAGDYLIDYLFTDGVIEVTTVRHGRMMPTPPLESDQHQYDPQSDE